MPKTLLMPRSLSTPSSPYNSVTVLTGEENFYSACKSWALDKETGHPVCTGDYHLGKYFCWRTEPVVPGAELISLYELISRLADEPRSFIIYGQPESWLPVGEKAQRKREFFHEPLAVQRLLVDVDGWNTDVEWWKGPSELRMALHTLLEGYGMGYLSANDCLVSLSQSAWPGGPLKCHLYYWLEEPVGLTSLREWARAVNDRCGAKLLDPVVYGHVHIDYTASRRCQGFTDPFSGRRLVLLTGAGSEEGIVAGVRVVDGLLAELDAAGPRVGVGAGGAEGGAASVGPGDAWAVLARSGQGGDINEYGYRAAARLVRDLGKEAVTSGLHGLAERMHREAWSVIAVNSGGDRGGVKDVDVYTVSRYRQYLQSACDASLGDAVDRYADMVRKAMQSGSAQELLSDGVVEAAARLKNGWAGLYQDLRREVKASRLVEMPVFDRGIDSKAKVLQRAVRLTAEEADEAMERLEVDGVVAGRIVDEEGNVNEVEFYRAVAASFDVVQGSNQAVFLDLGSENGDEDKGYRVLPLMALPSAIVVRAMDLAQSLGINRGQLFTGARAQVGAMIDQYISEHRGEEGQGLVPSKVYGPREVTSRWYRVPGSGVVWANLGGYRCARVEGDDYGVMTWQYALQAYPDAPIWTSTVDVEVSNEDLMVGEGVAWIDELFRLIRVDTVEERVMILAWIMSAVLGWPIRYILQLYGLPGSGKSTTGDILCEIVHPLIGAGGAGGVGGVGGSGAGGRGGTGGGFSGMTLEGRSRERRSLADLRKDPAINLSGVDAVVIDNIDRLTRSSQNWLCQLSTGLGVTREIKYTHIKLRENLQTGCVLTGISTHDTQADYGERAFDVEIVKRRDGIGSPERYWREIRGRVIGGLIRFAGTVVGELLERGENGGDVARDDLLQVVGRLVMGDDGEGGRSHGLGLASAERRVVQSAFSSCVLVWIQNDVRAQGRWLSTTMAHHLYESWVKANVGKVFSMRLPLDLDANFRVRWIRDGVDFTSSNNSISFGRAFWQRAGDLTSVLSVVGSVPSVVGSEGLIPIERRRTKTSREVRFNINDDDDQFLI